MRNPILGIVVITAIAGSISLSAQTPGQAPAAGQAPTAGQAQTGDPAPKADEIVGKYVAAIGGKDAVGQVKSLYMESSVAVMGNDSPSTTTVVDGVGYKSETEFNGSKLVQCLNDKGGWMINPMTGATDPAPMPDDQYKARKGDIYVGGPLYDYAAKGSKVELLGKDGDAYKIKLTTKDNVDSTFLIDPKSFLVTSATTKGEMQGQEVEITTKYSDYRKTDVGFLVPYAIDLDFGGQFQLAIAVKKVEVNKTFDPAIFEMPK